MLHGTYHKLIQFTIVLIALGSINIRAIAQNDLNNSPTATSACKDNKDTVAADLYGAWVLELSDTSASSSSSAVRTTRLVFKQNPEFAESLAGEFSLQGQRMEVFGDIENGTLDLEESANGKDISALWKGRIADGSCGKAIAGTRRLTATQAEQGFVLRRAGW